ncbi:MAG: hypothetical protein HC822_12480 [Oscillochloris sp.]|nr:hypothetical protein [Oscillochloris sp.]
MSLIAGNLGVVQRLLDGSSVSWGVCAGAAAHLYGNRRPIQDVDLLVQRGQLSMVVGLLQNAQKAVQFDGQRIIWRGIKVFDDLTVRAGATSYVFNLDELMGTRLRRMPLLGAPVQVIAPEDVLLHKLVLNRGAAQGKHDLDDATAIARRQQLDHEYLRERMARMNAVPLLLPRLIEVGVTMAEV